MASIVDRAAAQWKLLAVLTIVTLILISVMSIYVPMGVDWHETFYPATRELMGLHNPYDVYGFINPPWTLLPLIPMALLPENVGRAAFLLLSLVGFAFAAWRAGAKPIAAGAFIASPLVMHCVLNGNVDWMILVGFVLPPPIGLFFVVIKPQIGAAVAIFWLIEAWRKGRVREVVRVFAPVTIALLASFVIYGWWPQRFGRALNYTTYASLWPMSIPIGLALLVASIRRRRIEYAMAASPCLSPYVLFHSWAGALMAIVASSAETIAAVIGLWALVLIRAVS